MSYLLSPLLQGLAYQVLQMGASGEVAHWAGIQRSTVRMKGKADAIPIDLRVTEVFRREDGEWKRDDCHRDALDETVRYWIEHRWCSLDELAVITGTTAFAGTAQLALQQTDETRDQFLPIA